MYSTKVEDVLASPDFGYLNRDNRQPPLRAAAENNHLLGRVVGIRHLEPFFIHLSLYIKEPTKMALMLTLT